MKFQLMLSWGGVQGKGIPAKLEGMVNSNQNCEADAHSLTGAIHLSCCHTIPSLKLEPPSWGFRQTEDQLLSGNLQAFSTRLGPLR